MEMDSSYAMVSSLSENIPRDVLEYYAAIDILAGHSELMDGAGHRGSIEVYEPHLGVGYGTVEYLQTGEVPDYYSVISSLNGFYAKTEAAFNNTRDEAIEQNPTKEDQISGIEPTVPVILPVVHELLNADSPVYSEGETQIAQTFVDQMENSLGITPQSIEQATENTIQPDISDTPAIALKR